MNGQSLLDCYPDTMLEHGSKRRIDYLSKADSPDDFLKRLKQLARSSQPIWCYGLPRSGSSWFGRYFVDEFITPVYKEPFHWFHAPASGKQETDTVINKGTEKENERPEIQQILGLTNLPRDRWTLAIHDTFWFYHHLDYSIMEPLIQMYPQSRIMMWGRDGRDVIESLHNPDPDHWPQTEFGFLGDEKETRFEQATLRYILFAGHGFNGYIEHNERSLYVHYEQFTEDFFKTGSQLLTALNIDFADHQLYEQAEKFDARHGMWKQWDSWQRDHYISSQAREVNQKLGFDNSDSESDPVWKQKIKQATNRP